MAILDALTGNAGHQAAQSNRNVLGAIVPNLASTGQDAFRNARGYLQGGFDSAGRNLGTGYNTGTGALNAGYGDAFGRLDASTQGGLAQLAQARGDLTAGGGAFAPLTQLAQGYAPMTGLYRDSLGAGGAEGNARAQGAFQAGPGYQWMLDQGLGSINRAANARGMANSGNTDVDALKYGSGLANQEYGNWQNRLGAYEPLALQATQAAAAGNQQNNQALAALGIQGAGLEMGQGRFGAGLAQGQGQNLADLARQYYGGLASNDVAQGGALAGNEIGGAQNWQGIYGKGMEAWNKTLDQDAAASNAASENTIKLGMDLAKLAASAATGMPVGMGGGGNTFGGDSNTIGGRGSSSLGSVTGIGNAPGNNSGSSGNNYFANLAKQWGGPTW